jgi:hypothetical protein
VLPPGDNPIAVNKYINQYILHISRIRVKDISVNVVKAYLGSRGIAPLILNLGTR